MPASTNTDRPVALWHETVAQRVSRRRYDGVACAPGLIEALREHCERFRPYPDARVVLIADPPADVFTGIVGSYGKVSGAPHVLLMIADGPESEWTQTHVGYAGEAAILEATRLGLATCWVAGFFDRKKASSWTRLADSERVLAVSPVGNAAAAMSGSERVMRAAVRAHNRRPLDELAPGWGTWPEWARAGVQCARLAPSAVNRQPWRFSYDGSALMVSKDSAAEVPKVTKALDCGIAMLHIEIGAAREGVAGAWSAGGGGLELARFTPAAHGG